MWFLALLILCCIVETIFIFYLFKSRNVSNVLKSRNVVVGSTLLWSEGMHQFSKQNNMSSLRHEFFTQPIYNQNGSSCIVNCSDKTFPQDYIPLQVRRVLLEHQLVYIQNLDRLQLPDTKCKVVALPIGVDFHTVQKHSIWGINRTHWKNQETSLKQLRASNVEKICKVLVTWTKNNNSSKRHVKNGYKSRPQLWREAMSNPDVFELGTGNRDHTWKMMSEYAFVYSPIGTGFDCHRTWEALALGCIVIAQPNPTIKEFVDRYPIVLHNDPAKITQQDLLRWLHMYKPAKLKDLTIGTFFK